MFPPGWIALLQGLFYSCLFPPINIPLVSVSTLCILHFVYLPLLNFSTLSLVSPVVLYLTFIFGSLKGILLLFMYNTWPYHSTLNFTKSSCTGYTFRPCLILWFCILVSLVPCSLNVNSLLCRPAYGCVCTRLVHTPSWYWTGSWAMLPYIDELHFTRDSIIYFTSCATATVWQHCYSWSANPGLDTTHSDQWTSCRNF